MDEIWTGSNSTRAVPIQGVKNARSISYCIYANWNDIKILFIILYLSASNVYIIGGVKKIHAERCGFLFLFL